MTIYDYTVENMSGEPVSLDKYRDKVLLIVNSATQCGLTPQYEGLQDLYSKYNDLGLEILDFPSNQFLEQAPEDNAGIRGFCELNYGLSYEQFGKLDVNGPNADPLFSYLKEQKPSEWENDETATFIGGLNEIGEQRNLPDIRWNFTKFLVDREGKVVERFAPNVTPQEIATAIEALL